VTPSPVKPREARKTPRTWQRNGNRISACFSRVSGDMMGIESRSRSRRTVQAALGLRPLTWPAPCDSPRRSGPPR